MSSEFLLLYWSIMPGTTPIEAVTAAEAVTAEAVASEPGSMLRKEASEL